MKIPKFTLTQEAIAFGLAYFKNGSLIKDLKYLIYRYDVVLKKKLDKNRISNNLVKLSTTRQFLNEALQTMTGKLPIANLRFTYRECLFFDFYEYTPDGFDRDYREADRKEAVMQARQSYVK